MSYPSQPRADGDLVVGVLTARSWRILDIGADDKVLKANSLIQDLGVEWTNTLGVKTLRSDFTLTDLFGGSENLVIRVESDGVTSFVNSEPNQKMHFGGHLATNSLTVSIDTDESLVQPSSSRTLRLEGVAGGVMRKVLDGDTRRIPDGSQVIVLDEFFLEGTGHLILEGDAQLVVL